MSTSYMHNGSLKKKKEPVARVMWVSRWGGQLRNVTLQRWHFSTDIKAYKDSVFNEAIRMENNVSRWFQSFEAGRSWGINAIGQNKEIDYRSHCERPGETTNSIISILILRCY